MIAADFYRHEEQTLSPLLRDKLWQRVDRGFYVRVEKDGRSKIALDPQRGFERFSVMIGFDPTDVVDLQRELAGGPGDTDIPRGFLCGPYLNGISAGGKPRFWPARTKDIAIRSFHDVSSVIVSIGEPWLQSLRNPVTYAESADPTAALFSGFAWERAGNATRSHERYQEMWRRFSETLNILPFAKWTDHNQRMYRFVASKLGIVDEYAKPTQ
jgi:hypothetical protein